MRFLLSMCVFVSLVGEAVAQQREAEGSSERNPYEKYVYDNPRRSLYQCKTHESRTVSGGELRPSGHEAASFRKQYETFFFSADAGSFWSAGSTTQWRTVDGGDDVVAALPGSDPLLNVLRINVRSTPISFLLTNGMTTLTGTCQRKPG